MRGMSYGNQSVLGTPCFSAADNDQLAPGSLCHQRMQVVDACKTPLAEPAQDVTQADDTYQVRRLIAEKNAVDLGGGHAIHHTTNSLFAPAYGAEQQRCISHTEHI